MSRLSAATRGSVLRSASVSTRRAVAYTFRASRASSASTIGCTTTTSTRRTNFDGAGRRRCRPPSGLLLLYRVVYQDGAGIEQVEAATLRVVLGSGAWLDGDDRDV